MQRFSDIYENRSLSARLFLRRKFFTVQGSPMVDHIAQVKTMQKNWKQSAHQFRKATSS